MNRDQISTRPKQPRPQALDKAAGGTIYSRSLGGPIASGDKIPRQNTLTYLW